MKTKSLLLALFIIMIYGSTFAQETTIDKKVFKQTYKWGAGIGAGFTTGFGVSLKYQPRKDGIMLTFFPYVNNGGSNYGSIRATKELICAGLEYNHDLWDGPTNNVYFYVAGRYIYKQRESINYSYNSYYYTYSKETINAGCGIGFEYDTQKRIVVDLMAGFAQYNSFAQFTLTGEIALHYKFVKSS